MDKLIALGLFAVAGAILFHGRNFRMATQELTTALARLVGEVTETRGAAASAVAALNGIADALREQAAASDAQVAQALNDAADALDGVQTDLAAAIPANPEPGEDTQPGGEDTLQG